MTHHSLHFGLFTSVLLAPSTALADPPASPPPPKAPYSLPFQLRPVGAGSAVRSDTAFASYENPATGDSGSTLATTLLAAYKVADGIAPLLRVGLVSSSPPQGDSALGFLNPALGVTYALGLGPELKLGLFLGLTAPIGSGGGNEPKPENAAANGAGIRARSAMDNAMFAVNDFTVFPGVGLAWVASGLTVQVEATVLQLTRVRGGEAQADSSKTNFTGGVHVGYFLIKALSLAAELRHQRWLSTPAFIEADTTGTLRDTTTVAVGPRVHLELSQGVWLRPALALALPLDDPMKDASYRIVQLDLPLTF